MDYGIGAGPSAAVPFIVTASSLTPATGTLTLTAPANYSLSTSASGPFASTAVISYTGGSIAGTTVYARLNAGLVVGNYPGNATVTMGSTPLTQTVAFDGNVLIASCSDLIISKYVEGSASNHYIAIYNPTSTSINLANYSLIQYTDGSTTPSITDVLSGTLASGSVKVYKDPAATIYSGAATSLASMTFDGNDAIKLYNNTTSRTVDLIGHIGESTVWTSGGYTTRNATLVRKATVSRGVSSNPTATGFPTLTSEWDSLPVDNVTNLGIHTSACRSIAVSYDDFCSPNNLRITSKFSNWTYTPYNDAVNPNIDTVFGSTYGGSTYVGEPLGSCATGATSTYSTSWYSITTPSCAANRIRLSTNTTTTNFNSRIAVYGSTNPLDCRIVPTEIACNNDFGAAPVPTAGEVILTPGIYNPGSVYFVQISGYGGDQGNYGLIIDVDAPDISLSGATTTSIDVTLPTPSSLAGSGYLGASLRYRRTASTSGWASVTLSPTASSYTITGLSPNTSYDVWVVYNCQSDYWFSAKRTLSTSPGCLMDSFTSSPNVSNVAGHCRQITANWRRIAGATAYRCYWQRPGSTSISYSYVGSDSVFTSPANYYIVGTTYNFWVQGICTTPPPTNYMNSPTVSFTTCSGSPRLADPDYSHNYQIGDVVFYGMPIEEVLTYANLDNSPGIHEINIKEVANDLVMNKPFNAVQAVENISIFPNPADDQATIEYVLPAMSNYISFKLMDVNGKEVWTKTESTETIAGQETINLHGIASGVYFLKVSGDNYNKSVKLIVQH
jgi:hypothetical protein